MRGERLPTLDPRESRSMQLRIVKHEEAQGHARPAQIQRKMPLHVGEGSALAFEIRKPPLRQIDRERLCLFPLAGHQKDCYEPHSCLKHFEANVSKKGA